jgi:DNA-binding NarL/FixJ family response regulator
MNKNCRVVLADDHAVVRESLSLALKEAGGIEVVGEAEDGRKVQDLVAQTRPDVLIIDVGMPDLNGVEATRKIVADYPEIRVIALSAHTEQRFVMAMLEAGASGYAIKGNSLDELVHAVRAVMQGKKFISPDIAPGLVEHSIGRQLSSELTAFSMLGRREQEVLQLVAEGLSSKEIAVKLSISPATVETHRKNIMRKLDLHSVADLTRYAIREGLANL